MLKFLVYRVATIVPVLFGVSIVVFLMMKLIPGDPAEALLGPAATTEKIEMVRKSLGLDQPFYVQYFRWLWKVLHGDFGSSIAVNVPVAQLVWPKFWNTVLLTAGSLVICIVVGLGVGIVSGTRQYSWFDRISMSLTLIVANTPAFWLGLILMVVLALYLGWFPATGMYSMRAAQKTFGDLIHHMVLPAITTASVSAAIIARLVRSSFLDVIRKHYITALRACEDLDTLAFTDEDMKLRIEGGRFDVTIGSSSDDIRLRGNFNVEGTKLLDGRTVFATEAKIAKIR